MDVDHHGNVVNEALWKDKHYLKNNIESDVKAIMTLLYIYVII